ncbi:serine/threonine-protein phosphatase 6 regulatory ankyrin repeat subunit B-like [Phymastichus coffea]|uniref:serine/threonine-protein phosphatase 6 regulatory ankyrin repeat subunit B-like n=1 Tax=Phymastichus coffea TaxID=108790 RepID=UPI00273C8FD9|nr:serine/threonine-protein phosphatase 6 regulatory ankyrin repeat subunit B-like [Phymastichus coffea]XP_058796612.1 serine/threonine-protein phosphatase 6 regulatory ankyrin repeat subunit B-like [Phymastichus coffea]
MSLSKEDQQSYLKVAQIYYSFQDEHPVERIFKRILKKKGDINFKIPSRSTLKYNLADLFGSTALHIVAFKGHINAFNLLLNQGSDFTIRNHHGKTALHYMINDQSVEEAEEFVNSVLTAHIVTGDPTNPCDKNGLSHFHIACLKNNVRAVKFFLEMEIPVDEAVSSDSSQFAGYTPLHFAIKGLAVETAFLLLKNHADVSLTDARGMSALHMLLRDKLAILNNPDKIRKDKNLQAIDEILELLSTNHAVDSAGITKFHIACTMKDSSIVEYMFCRTRDVNHQVSADSPVFPGYTGLHFAAQCNIGTARLLISKGANFGVKDTAGNTPLDLYLENRKWQELKTILMCEHDLKNTVFANSKAKLVDFLAALHDCFVPSVFYNYLRDVVKDARTRIPLSSPLWPGFTPLHFAVLACEETSAAVIRLCLVQGAEAHVQDKCGWTPLHLAFRRHKVEAIKWLLLHHHELVNPSDDDGLTHLHIACATGHLEFVDRLQYSFDLNVVYTGKRSVGLIKPGFTLLHTAIASGSSAIVEILLNHCVDVEAKDANGETPIHQFLRLTDNIKNMGRILLASRHLKDHVLEKIGLSRIHLAVYCENLDEVDKSEANVDVAINCEDSASPWCCYNGYTPLYLAIKERSDVPFLHKLLKRGADILATKPGGMCPLFEVLSSDCDKFVMDTFVDMLKSTEDIQKRLKSISGITILHIGCYIIDVELINFSLTDKEIDANSQVHADCPIWPGDTPVHVMLKIIKCINRPSLSQDFHSVLELLLSAGADVTIANKDGDSPVHLVYDHFSPPLGYKYIDILISQQKDYRLNPKNNDDVSHFHLACMVNNCEIVSKFLQHFGTSIINDPIDLFAEKFAGETPLHLAVDFIARQMFGAERQLQTINLLLLQGANVCAEDNYGFTPLHKAVTKGPLINIIDKLVNYGAVINAESIFGETPLEIILKLEEIPIHVMKFFANLGCRLNSSNPITEVGYLSLVISNYYHRISQQVRAYDVMMNSDDMVAVDEMGRIAIHNIVTTTDTSPDLVEYTGFMETFFENDYDIDIQDKRGKSALHLAAKFGNVMAVEALLNLGANVNLLDKNNRTALFYAMKFHDRCKRCPVRQCHKRTIYCLARHIRKLKVFNLDIENLNSYLMRVELPKIFDIRLLDHRFLGQMEITKRLVVDEESKLYLCDFLSEEKAILNYPFMSDEKRNVVDEFFQTIDNIADLDMMKDICKLQYRKAIKRIRLVDLAADLMYKLMGFPVPLVCQKSIFETLKNSDIENFILATMNI